MINDNPFFSIIIPVYNAEKYLRECIESILSQNFNSYEIILINDGSKDSSAKICDEYCKRYYNKIIAKHIDNSGPLIARDIAMRMANGSYFLFIDSDDIFFENAFSVIYETIMQNNADMVLFDWAIVNVDGKVSHKSLKYENHTIFTEENKHILYNDILKTTTLNSLSKKCVKRNLIDYEVDYSQWHGMKQAEDAFVSIVYINNAKKIVYIKESLYGYRVNYGSTTHNPNLSNYFDLKICQKRFDDYIKLWNIDKKTIEIVYKNRMKSRFSMIKAILFNLRDNDDGFSKAFNCLSKDIIDDTTITKYRHLIKGLGKLLYKLLLKKNKKQVKILLYFNSAILKTKKLLRKILLFIYRRRNI